VPRRKFSRNPVKFALWGGAPGKDAARKFCLDLPESRVMFLARDGSLTQRPPDRIRNLKLGKQGIGDALPEVRRKRGRVRVKKIPR